MKNKFKKNYKFILGTIFGVIISASSVFAAQVLTSDKVLYDNTNSKLSSTNVGDAIDEVNTKATTTVVSGHGSTSGETNFISRDKLYLLSPKEVWNSGYDTATAETRQLDYYKNKGAAWHDEEAIKQYNGANNYWWLRGAAFTRTDNFLVVTNCGVLYSDYNYGAALGVSPAFRIA